MAQITRATQEKLGPSHAKSLASMTPNVKLGLMSSQEPFKVLQDDVG